LLSFRNTFESLSSKFWLLDGKLHTEITCKGIQSKALEFSHSILLFQYCSSEGQVQNNVLATNAAVFSSAVINLTLQSKKKMKAQGSNIQ
jgi:hypothetical protein